MSDYYKILGINKSATQDDIKKAYRKLAMKHHPDRGGNVDEFQKIEEAYRVLSNEETRYQYDNPQSQYTNFGGMDDRDVFSTFFGGQGFGFGFQQQQPKNANLGATVTLSLEDVFIGKTVDAEISFRNGQRKLVSINIPRGIDHGVQIRYPGMGDHSISKLPPGDLIVTVRTLPHPVWSRDGTDLMQEKEISVWDALLGTEIRFDTIDGRVLSINVPPGTQPGTMFNCKGEGMPHSRTGARGSAFIKVKVKIPKNLNDIEKKMIGDLKNGV